METTRITKDGTFLQYILWSHLFMKPNSTPQAGKLSNILYVP